MKIKNTRLLPLILFLALLPVSCVTLSEQWFFYPEQYTDLPAETVSGLNAREISFNSFDGTKLTGIIIENPPSKDYLIYFYGNMESVKESAKRLFFMAAAHKFNVICFDYRGYGKSKGRLSFDNLPQDGLAIYDFVSEKYKDKINRLFIFSQSLGTVPCTAVGAQRSPAGIIMEAPFTSAKEAVPLMTESLVWPFKDIIKLNESDDLVARPGQPIDNIKKFTSPLIIIHGEQDDLFPIRISEKLFNAAGSKTKTFVRLENTKHADVNIFEGRAFEEMSGFFTLHKK
ncbi:MAG: Alpha/beta hydrolase family protein [Candidatus Aerophobetes bacterium ADurb.Bin490]|nr:MAG: Alpha/beta hydrolase family protein [Candidatus Aerophobetes bacterium ADurb.Bin490]